MKTACTYLQKLMLSCCTLLLLTLAAVGQGRVVINEYMPWPSGSCGTTSEFVELLNFGPGPVNIGCYILANGAYSITIPANTILQPGQYYLISGQSVLPAGCGNSDSAVTAKLNWNTCNCTNVSIPTTGDGFMKDGGGANVNLVLMTPTLTVVDAVTRNTPVDAAATLTSSTASGGCTAKTFTINTIAPTYETLGMSTGRSNAFARKLDGGCDWEKQTDISANATNNTSSSTSGITYAFNIVRSMDLCDGQGGSISIEVQGSNVASYFPMNYTLAYDSDGNNAFDFSDTYTYGTDISPTSIDVANLAAGRYTITVGSSKGCNLKSFNFYILPCTQVLDLKLLYFKTISSTENTHSFEWKLSEAESLMQWTLESSRDGITFEKELQKGSTGTNGEQVFRETVSPRNGATYFRLRLTDREGKSSFSPILNIKNSIQLTQIGPNPVKDRLQLQLSAQKASLMRYTVIGNSGITVLSGQWGLHAGANGVNLPVQSLPPGAYQLVLLDRNSGSQPISFRFVKP